MQYFILVWVVGVQWALFGYSLSFGPDVRSLIGGLDWFGLKGVRLEPFKDYAATVPRQAFMVFPMMFAARRCSASSPARSPGWSRSLRPPVS